ncbi:MAG: transposase [Pseudomonadales bacterium]|nr:transposase [Pseudomonadales bacterium]
MSNHYHIVLRTDPRRPGHWSDDEVAERWLQICPGRKPRKPDPDIHEKRKHALLADPAQIERLRKRLGSLSWFMRQINEPLARRSNKEDGCTGRFWEGRFSSQAILDDAGMLACMVYVDLNPVRAGLAEDLADSKHTSVRHRISLDASEQRLAPIHREPDDADVLGYLTVAEYLELVRWTAHCQSDYRPGIESIRLPKVLQQHDVDEDTWHSHYLPVPHHWQRAIGSRIALEDYAKMLGQRWIKKRNRLASAR